MRDVRVVLMALVVVMFTAVSALGVERTLTPATAQKGEPTTLVAQATTKSWAGTKLTLGSSQPGGIWYLFGGAFADRLTRTINGLQVSNTTGSAVPNLKALNEGKLDIVLSYANVMYAGWNGKEPYKPPFLRNVRFAGYLAEGVVQAAVPKKSGINGWPDLKNKRINVMGRGTSHFYLVRNILSAWGITYESIEKSGGRVFYVTYEDAGNMMRNGDCDAVFMYGGVGPYLMELMTNPGIKFLGIEDKDMEKVLKAPGNEGMVKSVLPKVWYGLDKDVQTISGPMVIAVRADLPDDLVYLINKTMYEDNSVLKEVWGIQKGDALDLKKAAVGATVPIHPGTKRYFQEKGIAFKDPM
jgi:uncharacterized protein